MRYIVQWWSNLIGWVRWFWWGPMERVLYVITRPLGIEMPQDTANFVWKSSLILLGFFILAEIYLRLRSAWIARSLRKSMEGHEIPEPLAARKDSFGDRIEGAQHPVKTMERLRKEKKWGRMGEVFEALNQPDEAARWFEKDRQWERAAKNWAAAGKTARAARLLWKAGSWEAAARLYESIGKRRYAADAFRRAGKPEEAARIWLETGKINKALDCLDAAVTRTPEDPTAFTGVITRIWQLLEQVEPPRDAVNGERLRNLQRACAVQFAREGRAALAAHAFAVSGDLVMAAKLFEKAGDPVAARRCLEAAGKKTSTPEKNG